MCPPAMSTDPASRDLGALAADILALAATEDDLDALLCQVVVRVKHATGFECAGLRLKDGEDFPYYFTVGFDHDFVRKETFLCAHDQAGELIRDSDGNPHLECMCGNVITGRTNPAFPFFTKGGSFWSNGTSALLAETTDSDRQTRTRNRCNSEGYESVGLFPLKLGNTIYGLVQLNDSRTGQFSAPFVLLMEGLAVCIAMVFRLRLARQQASERQHDLAIGVTARVAILERIAKELKERNTGDQAVPAALFTTLGEILDDLSRASDLVPICASCKRIREPAQQWRPVEQFIADRSHVRLSHTYCPSCYAKAMSTLDGGAS
jgi:hypothetical protein